MKKLGIIVQYSSCGTMKQRGDGETLLPLVILEPQKPSALQKTIAQCACGLQEHICVNLLIQQQKTDHADYFCYTEILLIFSYSTVYFWKIILIFRQSKYSLCQHLESTTSCKLVSLEFREGAMGKKGSDPQHLVLNVSSNNVSISHLLRP